uniref:Uncharacterized protein n=1 Tax=Picea sitchensis TaxID=3332 RepID=A0A6B9XVG9_PICSI|nr:hypothetical protein Q903MT_gene4008 [Picea sitchensis]
MSGLGRAAWLGIYLATLPSSLGTHPYTHPWDRVTSYLQPLVGLFLVTYASDLRLGTLHSAFGN